MAKSRKVLITASAATEPGKDPEILELRVVA
jgi:hypothetical protein